MGVNRELFIEKCVELNSEILAYIEICPEVPTIEAVEESFKLITHNSIYKQIAKLSNEVGGTWSIREAEDRLRDLINNATTGTEINNSIKELNKISNLEESNTSKDLQEMLDEVENNG